MFHHNQLVLSCIDGGPLSKSVCDYATWVARSLPAPLGFLHTIENRQTAAVADFTGAIGLGASEELLNELTEVEQNRSRLLIKKGNLMLQAARESAIENGATEVEVAQRHGSLTESLIELEDQIQVLVVGISGEEHSQKTGVGAQLESVVRAIHRPILVVNTEFTVPRTIMLAYDGSEAAEKALAMIAATNVFHPMPCHLVHVTDEVAENDPLLQQGRERLESVGIKVTIAALKGRIEEAIPAYQERHNIDMTVMGAFSHTRLRDFFLGSHTAKVLENTNKPLLLLR